MQDVNGQELVAGGLAMLLCEIIEVEPEGVRIRIMNSEMELVVGAKQDEVLGNVADAELTAFTGPTDQKEASGDEISPCGTVFE